jgi:hypothetical protein
MRNEQDQIRKANEAERPSKFRKLLTSTSIGNTAATTHEPTYWPRDLLPTTAPNARVITYGYDTNIRHGFGRPMSQNTVYDIASDFLVSLEAIRRARPEIPLVFVAHSLGGIVVKEMLRQSHLCGEHHSHLHQVFVSTASIIFFGTPHGGADPRGFLQHIVETVAKVAGFSANPQIVANLLPSSDRLKELRDEFNPLARKANWIIHSFQEQYGVQLLNGKKVRKLLVSILYKTLIFRYRWLKTYHRV